MKKIDFTFPELMNVVQVGARARGDAWAAQWLAEELVKQPTTLLAACYDAGVAVEQRTKIQAILEGWRDAESDDTPMDPVMRRLCDELTVVLRGGSTG